MQCAQKGNVFTRAVMGDNAYYSLYIERERGACVQWGRGGDTREKRGRGVLLKKKGEKWES